MVRGKERRRVWMVAMILIIEAEAAVAAAETETIMCSLTTREDMMVKGVGKRTRGGGMMRMRRRMRRRKRRRDGEHVIGP